MTAPPAVRGEVARVLEGGSWEPVLAGRSASVWRITFGGARPACFVKVSTVPAADVDGDDDVVAEHARLAWLAGHSPAAALPVPDVAAFDPGDGDHPATLVTAALPGEVDLRLLPDVEVAVDLLAATLAAVHAVDPGDCPFDASAVACLATSSRRVADGRVTGDDLPEGYHRFTPARLVELLRQMDPGPAPPADRVLVHGDLCVSNVLVDPATGSLTGLVDWRWCGVGDRHLDLAVTAGSVVRNFGAEHLPRLFRSYGLAHPDPRRLEFYGLVEQLV